MRARGGAGAARGLARARCGGRRARGVRRLAGIGALPQVQQVARVELGQAGELAQQLALERAVGQQAPERARVAGHERAPLARAQVAALAGGLHEEAAERQRVAHVAREGVGAVGADEAVGVVLGGQEQELDGARVAGVGQGAFERLAGRAPARGVAVEAEDHLVREAEQLVHVLGRAGRAQGGHGVGKTELGQRHHVHVALGDQRVALLADGGARLVQAVELAALVEDRGLGRVQVLGPGTGR